LGTTDSAQKKKQKSDPWLTGCLGVVIIAIIVMVAFFLYDWLSQPRVPAEPPPSGAIEGLLVIEGSQTTRSLAGRATALD
jgi:hypothetical protein